MTLRSLAPRALLVLAALAGAAPAAAQVRPGRPPGPETERPQRPRQDSIPGDSAAARPAVQDSLFDRLRELPGYVAVEYQGDSAQFVNPTRTLRLRGRPVVRRLGTTIESTDSIVYRERSEFVEVYGDPRVTGEGQDVTGDVIFYDLAARRASVRGARTTITEGATWFVHGDVDTEEGGTRVYARGSTFTSDDREEPAYHFRADRIKVIKNRVLVGRPAYLYFRNVPVFALPFIVQDLQRGRRSGVLIPEFEINDIVRTDSRGRGTRGTGREIGNVGYYWAINEYMGVQAALGWRSQSWLRADVGYQFNWRRKFLAGSVNLQSFWADEGPNRYNVQGQGNWQPNERTTLATSINYTSSTAFERDRLVDPFRATSTIRSTFSLTRRLDWGQLTSGASLGQDIGSGNETFNADFGLSPETVNLFPTGSGTPRWYNDAGLTTSLNGSLRRETPGDALLRRRPPTESADLGSTTTLRLGQVSVGGGVRYTRRGAAALAAVDSARAIGSFTPAQLAFQPEYGQQTVDWSASTSYTFELIGSTRLSPGISIGQQLLQVDTAFTGPVPDSIDARRYGRFVAAPTRLSLNAGLRTDLFGFFPGFGSYSAIRHRVSPGLDYSYAPATRPDTVQRLVFGARSGREINQVRFNLDQTFEAKVRPAAARETPEEAAIERAGTGDPDEPMGENPGAQRDTAGAAILPGGPMPAAGGFAGEEADTAGAGGAARREEDRKITLLSVSTSALAYSFVPIDTLGTRFETDDLTNTIRSDLFGGLNFTVSHDLFDEPRVGTREAPGGPRRFSPFLTGVQTSLSFGANSALFRWLGFTRSTENQLRTERGHTPPEAGTPTAEPPGAQTFTNNPLAGLEPGSGGGPWNVSLNYSLRRQRPVRFASPLQTGTDNSQMLSGSVTFSPTRNWGVTWYTDYSLTTGEFGTHVLNLKRDLYRWQANFNFTRTPTGNTSFSFTVHLVDLPDLKADYSRQNLGADRPQEPR